MGVPDAEVGIPIRVIDMSQTWIIQHKLNEVHPWIGLPRRCRLRPEPLRRHEGLHEVKVPRSVRQVLGQKGLWGETREMRWQVWHQGQLHVLGWLHRHPGYCCRQCRHLRRQQLHDQLRARDLVRRDRQILGFFPPQRRMMIYLLILCQPLNIHLCNQITILINTYTLSINILFIHLKLYPSIASSASLFKLRSRSYLPGN